MMALRSDFDFLCWFDLATSLLEFEFEEGLGFEEEEERGLRLGKRDMVVGRRENLDLRDWSWRRRRKRRVLRTSRFRDWRRMEGLVEEERLVRIRM